MYLGMLSWVSHVCLYPFNIPRAPGVDELGQITTLVSEGGREPLVIGHSAVSGLCHWMPRNS